MKNTKKFLGTFENLAQAPMRSMAVPPPGVQHAVGHGGRMPLQISIQGGKNRSLPSNFSMTSLPVVRLRNDLYCVEWDVKLYYTTPCGPTEIQWKLANLSAGQHSAYR